MTRVVLWIASLLLCIGAYGHMVRGGVCVVKGLRGRVTVVTGANRGLGFEIAKSLARGGATVILACRDLEKAELAAKRIREQSRIVQRGQLICMQLDVASLESVRDFAEAFYRSGLDLHLLVLNAGALQKQPGLTEELLDEGLASNHLGHFLLVQALFAKLLSTERRAEGGPIPRVVGLSSTFALEHGDLDLADGVAFTSEDFDPLQRYGQAKLTALLCMRALAARLRERGSKVPVHCVHPGMVDGDISWSGFDRFVLSPMGRAAHWCRLRTLSKRFSWMFFKTAEEGACYALQAACGLGPFANGEQLSGELLVGAKPVSLGAKFQDPEECEHLWKASEIVAGRVKMEEDEEIVLEEEEQEQ